MNNIPRLHATRKNKRIRFFAVLIGVASMMTVAGAQADTLKWVGCGISQKAYMTAMAEAYKEKTGTLIDVQGGGATRGIRDVAATEADLGGSCRHKILAHEETDTKMVPVGWDAIVVITHPSNPVKNISTEQLKSVMEGNITNWKELGGPDAHIQLVIRKGKISGVGLMARELLFHDPDRDFGAGTDAHVMKSTGPVEKFIEQEPMAIGLTGISSGRKRNVNFMSLDGAEPTYDNIAAGNYPMTRPLYVTIPKDASDEVQQFVSFVTSPEGQEIMKSQGTVNMKDGQGLWPKYRAKMAEARKEGQF